MSPDRTTIAVLIDALGWKVLERRSFLDDFLPYRRPLRTILGYSSGAIPTILTGLPPSGHGRWNLMRYQPQSSPLRRLAPLTLLPDALADNRLVRKLIKEVGRRYLHMGPQFECSLSPRLLPYFDWVEKRNIYEAGGIEGTRTIFDELAAREIPYRVYSYHYGSDRSLLEQAKDDLESGAARFYFLYLCELDAFLHENIQDSAAVSARLSWYEQQLNKLFQCAEGVDPQTSFAVFSDHGMTPIHRHCDIPSIVGKLSLRMPDDYLAVYDSTMARFWFFRDQACSKIARALKPLNCGHWLGEEDLQKLGIWFPDGSYGEAIFLLDPGCLLTTAGARWLPTGMHGFDPHDAHSDAVFLASHAPQVAPQKIADIHDVLCELAFQEDRHAVEANLTA